MAGEPAPSLLTHSVRRDTGEAFWLLTKATLYEDPSGAKLAINIIEDVTDAKDAELRQRFLAEAGQLLASSLDYEQTLDAVARMIVPRLADWCGIDMVDEHGDVHQVAVAHVDPAKVEMAHELRQRYPPDMDAPTRACRRSCAARRSQLYAEIPDELIAAAAQDEEHLRIIRELGMRSAMAVPMRIGSETLGAISLVSAESGRRFDADDLAFAEDLALRAATAIQNARLYAAQERVAHTLQASLLPERLPELPGWEAHAAYQAGERGADVGGDFYDILPVESGYLIVLGDVTGKGIEAAALTSLVRHSGRMAARFDPRPAHVLALINEVLREQPRLSLVTAVCALLETNGASARLTVASGGHPLPLWRRGDETPITLGDHGVLLGVGPDGEWAETAVDVVPGDTLLFYTDGVTETPGEGSARFGELRLVDAMARAERRSRGAAGGDRPLAARVPVGHGGRRPRDARDAVLRTVPGRLRMRSRYDVVVVGGGHNGLVAAAYLARAGRSVLVLERSERMGGAAVSAAPFAGVDARLSRYAYLVSLLPRFVVQELGLRFETRRRRISSYTPVPGSDEAILVDTRRRRAHARVARAGHRRRRGVRRLGALLRPLRPRGARRVPDAARAAAHARRAARADRRRRGLGGAVRAPARRGDRGHVRRRRAARDRADRRADRHVRRRPRARPAPEPLLPLPRDRQRDRRVGRAGRRDGRADRRARALRRGRPAPSWSPAPR